MRIATLLARTSLAASALASCYALPAYAQAADAVSEDDGAIVVTARRREESLVDVPIAITALSGDQLAAKGAGDITALAETVPNVTLEASRATNSTLSAFIRGVGQQDPVSGFEQGVGIYLDDVYLNRPQAAVLDIYDVQRIEVLRGPQGTLYGRNTVGGAIKYVTKRIDDVAHVSARATYGSYDQADGVLTASTPVGDGTLRFGGSLARLSRGGFGKNLTTGLENYNKDVWAGRGTIEVHADDFFGRLSADYTRDKSLPRGGHRLIPAQFTTAPVLSNVYDTRGAANFPQQDVKAWGASLFLEGKPSDWLTVRSISSYRKDDSATPIDFDALPTVDLDVPGYYKNRQFSQEVQFLINAGKLNGLIGAYYLNATALTQFESRLYTTIAGFAAFTNADIGTDTLAGFADFSYDLTDQLSLSLGGRYTWDKRDGYILRQNYLGGGSPVFASPGVAFGAAQTNFRGSSTFKKFTPKASISFKPSPGQQVYASFSQGFKGGGFDPRGVGINAVDLNNDGTKSQDEIAKFLSFRPEKVNSYELGYKADLFDRRVYLALAGFYMDYTDVQIPGSVACNAGGVATFCGVVSNAGKARMKGFEAEMRAKLVQSDAGTLTLTGSLGYIDAKYTKYIANIASVPTDVAAFRKVQNTPAWSGAASLDYTMDLMGGSLTASGGMSFKSKTYQFEVPNPYLDQPSYQLFDASLVYKAEGGRWSLGVFGKNLANTKYKTSGYTFMAANATTGALTTLPSGALVPALGKEGVLTAFYGNPRQVYVTASVNF
ncbi:TonB-dependent receptor [Novosphingobium sp. B 225]|uniref:TonB-dependent receptor n=1 Tax=Novosphingobium sp. B 225 TaxID=1961849 RepID=UPI000B4B34AE|nr:TonB-dependent receptor [Novosphingobium sp. B 225]